MRIDNPSISGSLSFIGGTNSISATSVSLTGSLTGTFEGAFSGDSLTNISGAFNSVSESLASERLKNTTDTLTGDLTVTGKITAQEFHTEFVSASILYDSGSTQFGNSADDTHIFTGNVGIGISNPQAAISIVKSGLATQLRISNTESDATTKYGAIVGSHYSNSEEPVTGMLITSNSSITGGSVSIGGGVSASNAVNKILFYTAANNTTLVGTERMRIDQNGNLGIGTTSPGTKLHLESGVSDGIIVRTSANVEPFMALQRNAGSNGVAVLRGMDGGDLRIDTGATGAAQSTKVTIEAGGNVGIGATSPTAKLNLYNATEDVSINVNTGTGGSYPKKTGISFGATSTSLSGDAKFRGGAGIQAINTAATNNPTELVFWTTSGGSPSERLHIDSNGVTSIYNGTLNLGTDSVASVINSIGDLFIFNVDSNNNTGGTPNFRFRIGSTTDIATIDGTGVGIGTTSPTTDFDLVGNARIGIDTNHALQITEDAGNNQMVISTTQRTTLANVRDIKFRTFGPDGTDNILVLKGSNGNVGIGTNTPNYLLDIEKSGANVRIYDTTGNTTLNLLSANTANNNIEFGDPEDPNVGQIVYRHASDSLSITTNASEALRIDNSQNVGIGTTIPGAKLDVNGDINIPGTNKIVFNNEPSGWYIHARNSDSTSFLGTQLKNTIICGGSTAEGFAVGGAQMVSAFEVKNSGDVYIKNTLGIGTTSANEKLHVSGDVKVTGRVYVKQSDVTSITPSSGDWVNIAQLGYGEHHGVVAFEWNGLYAPGAAHHGWIEIEVGTYYSSNYNYGWDTYLEVKKTLAHNDFWIDEVRAVDGGSVVTVQVKVNRNVSAGSFRSYVLAVNQGDINTIEPIVDSTSYSTVLKQLNLGTVGGGRAQVAFANKARFRDTVIFDGYVQKPGNPAFKAYDSTGTTWSAGVIVPNVEVFDIGGNYNTSNGIFTAPLDGVYLFRADWRTQSTAPGYIDIRTSVSDLTRHEETSGDVNIYHQSLVMIAKLSVGDTAYLYSSGTVRWDPSAIDNFSGVYLG